MLFCTQCKKEMACIKNGTIIHYGHGHCYPADDFVCKCNIRISKAAHSCHYEPEDLNRLKESGTIVHEVEE